jgi:5-methylcytosine-specific restriction protein A
MEAREKLLIVDLNRGSYLQTNIGLEIFNLDRNRLDGKYYGYIPPRGKVQLIDKLGGVGQPFADGITVVYVQSINNKGTDREVIAFCTDARVYRSPQLGNQLNRGFEDNDGQWKYVDYHVVSDNMVDLSSIPNKLVIETKKYNSYLFRSQRTVLDDSKYPSYRELRSEIINYVVSFETLDQDLGEEQELIQEAEPGTREQSRIYGDQRDEITPGLSGKSIKKNQSIAKRVLETSNYSCLCDCAHRTFLTERGKPYMEGHHLIPCTVANSQIVWEKYHSRTDREENIICICPTCHRAIHFGDKPTRRKTIQVLYEKQKDKLFSVGIEVGIDELFTLCGLDASE